MHGEAIAVGMILESYLSLEKKLISKTQYQTIKSKLKNLFPFIEIETADQSAIIDLLIHDKKNEYGNILFVLLDGIGNTKLDQKIDNQLIMNAFADYKI